MTPPGHHRDTTGTPAGPRRGGEQEQEREQEHEKDDTGFVPLHVG